MTDNQHYSNKISEQKIKQEWRCKAPFLFIKNLSIYRRNNFSLFSWAVVFFLNRMVPLRM